MTCPACAQSIADQEPIHNLLICDHCLASVLADTGERATAADTLILTPSELAALRARRKMFRDAQVPA